MASRSAAVQRQWDSEAQAVERYFQPKGFSSDLVDHTRPLLVRLAWAETDRSMGPKPLLHPWFVPVASQTHLSLGQASDQALRLVGRCKYAKSALCFLWWPISAVTTFIWVSLDLFQNANFDSCGLYPYNERWHRRKFQRQVTMKLMAVMGNQLHLQHWNNIHNGIRVLLGVPIFSYGTE